MKRAVIFDMDGLLVDTEPLWDATDSSLLKKRGFVFTYELKRKRTGTGHHNTLQIFKDEYNLPDDINSLLSERLEIFDNLIRSKLLLMSGAKELIKLLISMGFKLGIATGGHDKNKVEEILKRFRIEKNFHSITTGYEVKHGKPAPDIFLLEAEKLMTEPSRCLVLEDAPSGVDAARAAGMKVIAVNDTNIYRPEEFRHADLYLRSFDEIDKKVLENIFNY